MHVLDTNQLQLDIAEDKSMIFRDATTNEIIGLVLRRFAMVQSVVDWADSVLVEGCTIKVNARVSNQQIHGSIIHSLTDNYLFRKRIQVPSCK